MHGDLEERQEGSLNHAGVRGLGLWCIGLWAAGGQSEGKTVGQHCCLLRTVDLEDVGPALARNEEAVALLVVRDAVEHVLPGGGTEVAGR